MKLIYFLLLLAAAVCFVAAAFGRTSIGRRSVNLVALGLMFWVLVPLIQELRAL